VGWSDFWDNVERGYRDIEDWYGDTTDEGYSWFGIESQNGQVQVTNAPRAPRYAGWVDATDPNARGPRGYGQRFFPRKAGYSLEVGAEFYGSPGSPPEGTKFIGHAPQCVFDSLTMTMIGAELVDDPEQTAGFSARLVQRDYDGRPNFISGPAQTLSDDGVVYRQDLRLPAKSPLRAITGTGGPVARLLPMFITLAPYGDIAAVTGIEVLQVQVTANLLVEALPDTARIGEQIEASEVEVERGSGASIANDKRGPNSPVGDYISGKVPR